MTEEEIRYELAAALVRADIDSADETGQELYEYHHCFQNPNCYTTRDRHTPCACAGVPYLSEAAWTHVGPVIEKIRSRS